MSTIGSAREIDRLFTEGAKTGNSLVTIIVAETPSGRGPEGRVVFVAGKRLGSAPKRNRAKRVLRESARRVGGPWPGYDVALQARAGTGAALSAELDAAMGLAIKKAGLGT